MENEKNQNVDILDLDEFTPPDRRISINKKEYLVRGNASVKETIALARQSKDSESPEAMESLIDRIQSFFIDPIDKEELLKLDMTSQLPELIAFLYGRNGKGDTDTETDKKKSETQSQ